ncbi:MAG: hypothetical protein AAFV25_24410 [Bacteroidota bacterium]
MSFLMTLIKRYFAQVEFERQDNLRQQQLCRALRSRGEVQLFQKELNQWERLLQSHPLRNIQYHYYQYQKLFELYQFESQASRKGDAHLQERFEELSIFYLSNTLLHACASLNQQNILKKDVQLNLVQQVVEHIEQHDYSQVPAVMIYYYAYQALSQPGDDDKFEHFKSHLLAHWPRFTTSEARDVFLIAVNYCIQRLNQGERRFVREAFDLYRLGVENGIFIQNDILSDHTYKNIIRLGISLKEFDWVAQFQKDYKDKLDPRNGQNAYCYNLAYFHFQRSEYDKAMPLLQQVEFKDVFNNLDARRMLLRIYYELGEYDALDSLLDSFYTYIHRQKDIGYHRDNYLNLIRFIRKLLHSNSPSSRSKLRQKVLSTTRIAEREWLLAII